MFDKNKSAAQKPDRILIRISDSIPQPPDSKQVRDLLTAKNAAGDKIPFEYRLAFDLVERGKTSKEFRESVESSSATLNERGIKKFEKTAAVMEALEKYRPETVNQLRKNNLNPSKVEIVNLKQGESSHGAGNLIVEQNIKGELNLPKSELRQGYYSEDFSNKSAKYLTSFVGDAVEKYKSGEIPSEDYQNEMPPSIYTTTVSSTEPSERGHGFRSVLSNVSNAGRGFVSNAADTAKTASQIAIKKGINKLALAAAPAAAKVGLIAAVAGAIILAIIGWLVTVIISIIIGAIAFIVFVVVVLFIINSGAYVVPPGGFGGYGETSDTSQIRVAKTSNPSGGLTNGQHVINYEIRISSLNGDMTNISSVDNCYVSPNGTCPEVENIRAGYNSQLPTSTRYASFAELQSYISSITIRPSDPFLITYSRNFNLTDSTASDTFQVNATIGSSSQTGSGSTFLCFGDCPNECFEFVGDWPDNERHMVEQAVANIAGRHPAFMNKVCAGGTINLGYDPTRVAYCGWHIHNYDGSGIDILLANKYNCLESIDNAEFLLAHEISHHLSWISPGTYSAYEDSPAYNERPLCTYPEQPHPRSEDFAETNGLYVNDNIGTMTSRVACIPNGFAAEYPAHYQFAHDIIFEE
jgi:hypothetical protein